MNGMCVMNMFVLLVYIYEYKCTFVHVLSFMRKNEYIYIYI